MTEGDALKRAVKLDKRTAKAIAEELGISRVYFESMYKNALLSDTYKIKLKEIGIDIEKQLSNANTAEEPRIPYHANKDSKLIPYYNIDVTAGAKDLFLDSKETIDYNIDMPGFKDCDFAVPVSGHSMYPKISSGNIIFCKKVNHREFIEYGHIYLIVTNDRRMIKQIRKADDKDSLLLVSENPEYDTFDIKKDLIQHLYLVKGWANKNEI